MLIMLISGGLIINKIQPGHNWGGDFSLYINQSKHIIESYSIDELYEWNKISMQHSNKLKQIGPYAYPNGFPILLSPIYYFFGIDFVLMKVLCGLFFLLSIPLMFNLFKEHFKDVTVPMALVCLFAFNNHFIDFADNILSDLPFLFFCLLTFYIMTIKNNIMNQILLGACLFFSCFIRDVGIFLIPALLCYQILHSEKYSNNKYHTIIPYSVFFFFFVLRKLSFPIGGENHINFLVSGLYLDLVRSNLKYYISLFSYAFFNYGFFIIGLVFIVIAIFGAFLNFKKHLHFTIFILSNMFILIIWPARQGIRYLFPILPFITFFFLQAIIFIQEKLNINSKYQRYILILCVIAISSYSVIKLYSKNELSNQAYTSEMVEIYNYIAQIDASDNIIGFRKPRVLWLFSGARSVYTDLNHFDDSIASYLLIKKDSQLVSNRYEILKEFQNYVLIQK